MPRELHTVGEIEPGDLLPQLGASGSWNYGNSETKVPGLFESVTDVLELPIKVSGDRVVTFQDVAVARIVYDRHRPDVVVAHLLGCPSVTR